MYGFLIGSTTFISILIAEKIVKSRKLFPVDDYWTLLLLLIPVSVVGGRIYHVLDFWEYYSSNPSKIIAVWEGGLGIFGALFVSFLTVYIFSKLKKQSFFKYTDLFLLFVPLVQIAGRFGNYFNNELFGKPTTLPVGVFIPAEYRPEQFLEFETFHPLFFYEAFLLGLVFSYMILLFVKKQVKIGQGFITALFLISYGIIRIILESLRIEGDSFLFAGLNLSYFISFVLIASGFFVINKSRNSP